MAGAGRRAGKNPIPRDEEDGVGDANEALLHSIKLMMDEMRSDILSKFDSIIADSVKREMKKALKPLQDKITTQGQTIAELERSASDRDNTVAELQTTVNKLTKQVESLSEQCETLQSRSRWNNVRLVGLSESEGGPRTSEFVAQLLKDLLKLDELPMLDRCHRSLRPRPKDGEPPRPLVMRVHYFQTRNLILRRARECSPLMYNGKRLSIYPDFTPAVAKKRALFSPVKRELNSCTGVKFGLMFPAVLRLTLPNGQTHRFEDHEKAMDFVVNNLKKGVTPEDIVDD